MSDPVPNDDLDGVLSSIRRLVAENPKVTPADTPLATGEANRRAGMFVLTDALRAAEPAAETPARPQVVARRGLLSDIGGGDGRVAPSGAGSAPLSSEGPAAPIVLTGPTFATPDDTRGTSDIDGSASDTIRAELVRAVDEVVPTADAIERDSGQADPARTWTAEGARDMQSKPGPVAGEAGLKEQRPSVAPLEMDEETLRRLVAEIVRAELQGALGERITRNVRKLVRHEVHRALSSRNIN